jgi:hypothetical protein
MKDVSLFAAEQTRKAGIPMMLDAGRVREGMLELARLCDYVVGSEQFAMDLGWKDDPAADEVISCSAFPIDVVDTTSISHLFPLLP